MLVSRRVKVETKATADRRKRACGDVAWEEAGVGSEEEGETGRLNVDHSFGRAVESRQPLRSFGCYHMPLVVLSASAVECYNGPRRVPTSTRTLSIHHHAVNSWIFGATFYWQKIKDMPLRCFMSQRIGSVTMTAAGSSSCRLERLHSSDRKALTQLWTFRDF